MQNLNEKVPLAELKDYLYQLFSNLGINVIEVHCKKNIRMRGQAFIVCGDEQQAELALSQLTNHLVYGKPLRLSFARKFSDVTAKMRGVFDESVKMEREDRSKESLQNKETKRRRKMIEKLLMLRK